MIRRALVLVAVAASLTACRPSIPGDAQPESQPPPTLTAETGPSSTTTLDAPMVPSVDIDLEVLDRQLDELTKALDSINLNETEGDLP